MRIFQPHTLQLSWPFGQTLLLAGAMLAALLVGGELLARAQVATGVFDPVLPPSSVGGVSPELDVKVELLDRFVAQHGPVRCIFLGSSQIDGGIDPQVLAQSYTQSAGQPLECFNFGLVSLTGEAAGPVAQMLVARYHPDLLVVGLSARDFSADFGELSRPLVSIPWLRSFSGTPSRQAWLIDRSSAYRSYLGLLNWRNPDNRENIRKYETEVLANGYVPVPQTPKELVQLDEVLLTNYTLNPPDLAGLESVLQLNGADTRVILLEMPVHPAFYPNYVEGGSTAYQELFFQPIAGLAGQYGVPFWASQETVAPTIPADGWNDRRHFNTAGAAVFSQWLAGRLVEEDLP